MTTPGTKADITQINAWYKTAQDEWADYRERARKAYKFYFGQQWDPTIELRLKKEGKPALTMNKIKPVIRTLSGYMRQNRRDQYVAPRRGGVQIVASIYTELLKYIYDISYADWYNAYAFFDGIVGGKGFLSLDKSFDLDPITGDILISREDPFLVLEDPFSQKYDFSDGRFIFRGRWMEKDQINMMFPETKDMTDALIEANKEAVSRQVESKDYTDTEKISTFEISKNRFLVKECFYRTWNEKKFIMPQGMDLVDVTGTSDEELNALIASRTDLKLVKRVMPQLNMATVLGSKILYENEDPFNGCIRFPIIRFCNEFVYAEKAWARGEVEDIISPQEEHNKRKSQLLHILNSTPNSGYIVERGALKDDQSKKLETMGSRPGVVIVVEDGKLNAMQKINPPQLSEGHVALSQMADTDMKAISGVNADLLGADKSEAQSGIAMEMRRRQGLINLEPVFDNFDFTQRMLGDALLDMVRYTDAYTPEEIAAMVGNKVKSIDGKSNASEAEIMAFMRTQKGRYSVAMSQRQNNPTIRLAQFKDMLTAIRDAQIPVPPDMIVEASDWEFKDKWLEWFKTQQAPQPGPAMTEQGPNPPIFAPDGGGVMPPPEGAIPPDMAGMG